MTSKRIANVDLMLDGRDNALIVYQMDAGELKNELATLCRRLYDRHLVSGCGGNVAGRFRDGMIVTPSGASLGELWADDMVTVDSHGNSLDGRVPTKEASLHRAILDSRPEARIVAHTHNPHATAVSALMDPGPDTLPPMTPGFVFFAWPLPMIGFHIPGSEQLNRAVMENIGDKSAILLQNHGLISWADTCSKAMMIAEEVEEAAQVWLLSGGKGTSIDPELARRIW